MPFPYSFTLVVLASGPPGAPRDPTGLWAGLYTALRLDAEAEFPLSAPTLRLSHPDEHTLRFYLPRDSGSELGRYDPLGLASSCTLRIEPVPVGLEVTLQVELLPLLGLALGLAVVMVLAGGLSPANGAALALAVLGIGYPLVRWRVTRWLLALTRRSDDPAAT